jgi:hypothetical protein
MVFKTNAVPHHTEEVFDERDREEIHRIIADLRRTYFEYHTEAISKYYKIQRESNRALHEVTRIEKHLERIDEFCTKNNIPTNSNYLKED